MNVPTIMTHSSMKELDESCSDYLTNLTDIIWCGQWVYKLATVDLAKNCVDNRWFSPSSTDVALDYKS